MRKGAAIRDGRLFSARQLLISPRAASAIGVLLLLIGAISTTALLIFLISLPAALVALLALDLILTLRHRHLLYRSGGHSFCSAGPTYRYIGAWGLPGQGMPGGVISRPFDSTGRKCACSLMRPCRGVTTRRHTPMGSINVGSSSGARELFTRFDTGHRCKRPSAAGRSNSVPAAPDSQGS